MSEANTKNYQLLLNSANLYVQKMTVSDTIVSAIENFIQSAGNVSLPPSNYEELLGSSQHAALEAWIYIY